MSIQIPQQFSQVFTRINEKNPYLFLIGLLVTILVLDYFCIMQFQIKVLSSLNSKTHSLAQDLKTNKDNIARLDQYRKELNKLNEQLEKIGHKMKSKDEIPLILENITRMADENGLKIDQIMPGTMALESLLKNNEGQYFLIPVVMEAQGGYHDFGRFLNQLEKEEVLFTIPYFTISANNNDPFQHLIKLTINAIIFEKNQN